LVAGFFMRAGFAFSAVAHVALLLWGFVLFASPKPFTPIPAEAITVDIVPATAMARDPGEPSRAENAAAQQQPGLDREPEATGEPQSKTASAPPQPPAQEQLSRPREPLQAPPAQPAPAPNLLVFNATVPPVQELPLPPSSVQDPTGDLDALADSTAKLSIEEVAAFRSHLQKCWNPPADIADAQKLKVVLRVALQPNGALTGSPVLLEASASAHGPALVETARTALHRCQPYRFLPAAKYQEWKLLDLSFSPRGLSGG